MKFFVASALFAAATATVIPAAVSTGSSAVSRQEDGLGNYAFGYNEDHATGGTFRKEQGGPGYMSGSYGLRDADGRMRVVSYVADALGYRANVATNEPGTDVKQDPAAVDINLGAAAAIVAPAAPVAAYSAPIAAPVATYAAPIAAPVATYAAPIAAKTVAYAAPAVVAPVAQATSYSTGISHVQAAPLAVAAPVAYAAPIAKTVAYAAPAVVAAAPAVVGHATSYSTGISHVSQVHAPVYAAKAYGAIASPITGFSTGYVAPAIAHGAYSVNAYSSPVLAAKTVGYASPVVAAAKVAHF